MLNILFNNITQNIHELYRVTYTNNEGKEVNVKISPQFAILEEFCNPNAPQQITYGTNFIQSDYFSFAEDASFFNPFSIMSLVNVDSYDYTKKISYTNKAFAFPVKKDGYVKINYLASLNKDTDRYLGFPYNFITANSNKLTNESNVAIVNEKYKRHSFTRSFSKNIEEIEKQSGKSWMELLEEKKAPYAALYPISTSDSITFESEVAYNIADTSENKWNFQQPRGLLFRSTAEKFNYSCFKEEKYTDVWYNDYGTYTKRDGITYTEFNENIHLINDVYYIPQLTEVYFMELHNPNDVNDYYYQSFHSGGFNKFPGVNASYKELGKMVLKKINNKWRMVFSSSTFYDAKEERFGYVGYYEGEGDPRNGIDLYYYTPIENEKTDYYITVKKYYKYFIPKITKEPMFQSTSTIDSANMNPASIALLPNNNDKNYYICTDTASYSIAF